MAAPFEWFDALVDAGWLHRLTGAELSVLVALGRSMTQRSPRAFPSARVLAVRTGLGKSAVYQSLSNLRSYGLITPRTIERPGKYRMYAVVEYSLVTPIPPVGSVHAGGPYSAPQAAAEVLSADRVLSTPADTTVHAGGHQVLIEALQCEDLKASTGGPPEEKRPLTRTVRTSSPSPAEALVGLRRHVVEVLSGNGALPPVAIRALVAAAAQSGIAETDARRVITEAVAAASHPLVAKTVQVFNGEAVEVALTPAHRRAPDG